MSVRRRAGSTDSWNRSSACAVNEYGIPVMRLASPATNGRRSREVRVQVRQPLLAGVLGEGDGGDGLVRLRGEQLRQRTSDAIADPRLGLAQRRPQQRRLARPRQVAHGRRHACELRVEARILRGAQGEDGERLPRCLAREQLRDDERLREARVHLHDVADAAARVVRLQ